MSQLLDFYRGTGTDVFGRSLAEILAWDDADLEAVHDFIQWVFPLPEPSRFNPTAPLLTAVDIAAFQSEPLLRANLRKSFERILPFLGLTLDASGQVSEGPTFAVRSRAVWAAPNHNWLRITRILRSLRMLGLESEAQTLFERLKLFHQSGRFSIPADTFRFWTDAVKG